MYRVCVWGGYVCIYLFMDVLMHIQLAGILGRRNRHNVDGYSVTAKRYSA